jgi:hypothetical protein
MTEALIKVSNETDKECQHRKRRDGAEAMTRNLPANNGHNKQRQFGFRGVVTDKVKREDLSKS